MTPDRIVTVRPASLTALRELVVSEHRAVLLLPTRTVLEHGDRVLLDIKLPEMTDSVMMRARVSYTLPENRGPFFAVAREDLPRFAALIGGAVGGARIHSRYPARIDARVRFASGRWLHAQLTDVSISGARVAVVGELPVGETVSIELARRPGGLPARFSAEVRAENKGTFGVRFASADLESRRAVRSFIRRAEATGEIARLDA